MNTVNKPAIGTMLWIVEEHLYYQEFQTAPVMEYVIYPCKVTNFITGKYTEMRLEGKGPDGYIKLRYRKLTDIGKKVFNNPQDAARLALKYTEDYEQIWLWTGERPLRRTWAKYLDDKKENRM